MLMEIVNNYSHIDWLIHVVNFTKPLIRDKLLLMTSCFNYNGLVTHSLVIKLT